MAAVIFLECCLQLSSPNVCLSKYCGNNEQGAYSRENIRINHRIFWYLGTWFSDKNVKKINGLGYRSRLPWKLHFAIIMGHFEQPTAQFRVPLIHHRLCTSNLAYRTTIQWQRLYQALFWKTPRISQVGRVIKGVRPAPNDSLLLKSLELVHALGRAEWWPTRKSARRGIFAHLLQHLSQMTIWDGEENTWACQVLFLCLINRW